MGQFPPEFPTRRQKLIDSKFRSYPLRRIKDRGHAFAILKAFIRHNDSNYESLLMEARELANLGEIDHDDVKSYARQNTTYWSDVQSTFFDDGEHDADDIEQ